MNDHIGDVPVIVYANPQDMSVHIYVRQVGERVLEFAWTDGQVKDQETGTRRDPTKGLAIEGALRGELLKELPYSTAYHWAREDFYPHTEVYSLAP